MIVPRSFSKRRQGVWALRGLAMIGFVVVFGDCLASDLPIAMHWRGATYLLPNVLRPSALWNVDNQQIAASKGPKDWVLFPLSRYGPYKHAQTRTPPPTAPSSEHLFGTDDRGRDVFARLIHGTRTTTKVALLSVCLALCIGLPLGLWAGYRRGVADFLISRLIEVALALPSLFLILVIVALVDRPSSWALILVIGLTRWTSAARLMRAESLRLVQANFVQAARLMGKSDLFIIWRHVLPNAAGPLVVNTTFALSSTVLIEAALGFLGFGVPQPLASWGGLVGQGIEQPQALWLVIVPGVAIVSTVLCLDAAGEWARRALDPRSGGLPLD
ncbi:MAG: ABC transporter permease [Deltaproteobacteria bacterium]|nr:ABC transporter permease [Deltaproteobacteria bacterium]